MAETVNVFCPSCEGTGTGREGYGCSACMTQGHIRVDRDRDGAVPGGLTEWVDAPFGPVPDNPLILTSNARSQ